MTTKKKMSMAVPKVVMLPPGSPAPDELTAVQVLAATSSLPVLSDDAFASLKKVVGDDMSDPAVKILANEMKKAVDSIGVAVSKTTPAVEAVGSAIKVAGVQFGATTVLEDLFSVMLGKVGNNTAPAEEVLEPMPPMAKVPTLPPDQVPFPKDYYEWGDDHKVTYLSDLVQSTVKQANQVHADLHALVGEFQALNKLNKQLTAQCQAQNVTISHFEQQNTNLEKKVENQEKFYEHTVADLQDKLKKVTSDADQLSSTHTKSKSQKVEWLEKKVDELTNDLEEAKNSYVNLKTAADKTLEKIEAHAEKTIKDVQEHASKEIHKELQATKESYEKKLASASFKIEQLEQSLTNAIALHQDLHPGTSSKTAFQAVEHALLKVRELRGRHLEALVAEALEADNDEPDWSPLPIAWSPYAGCPGCKISMGMKMTPIESHKNGTGYQCENCKKTFKDTTPNKASAKKATFDRIQAVQALVLELGYDVDMAVFAVDSAGPRRILDFVKKVPTVPTTHSDALAKWAEATKNSLTNEVVSKHEVTDAWSKVSAAYDKASADFASATQHNEKQAAKVAAFGKLYGHTAETTVVLKPTEHPAFSNYDIKSVEVITPTIFKVAGVTATGSTFSAEIHKPETVTQSQWDKAVEAAKTSPAALSVMCKQLAEPEAKKPTKKELTVTEQVKKNIALEADKAVAVVNVTDPVIAAKLAAGAATTVSVGASNQSNTTLQAMADLQSIVSKIKAAHLQNSGMPAADLAKQLALDPEIASMAGTPEVFAKVTKALAKELADNDAAISSVKHLSASIGQLTKNYDNASVNDWTGLHKAIIKHGGKANLSAPKKGKTSPAPAPTTTSPLDMEMLKVMAFGAAAAGVALTDDEYNPIDLIPHSKKD